jgi:hypothetical protein
MLFACALATASVAFAAGLGVVTENRTSPGPARKFSAFSWTHMAHIPQARDRWHRRDVTDMVVIAPWTQLDDAAARLAALPPGKRWVMFFIITDKLADDPRDYCVRREVKIETAYVREPSSQTGRAVASARQGVSGRLVPIQRRVVSEVPTSYRGIWMDHGISEVRSRVQAIMSGLKSRGAVVDAVVVDNETTLHSSFFIQRPGSFAAIQADPRWPATAASLGLPVKLPDVSWGSDAYFRWNQVMAGRFDRAMNAAVYQPIRNAYPNAACSNYCSGPILPGFAWPDTHGHLDLRATNGFGTHDSEEFYGWTTPNRTRKTTGQSATTDPWRSFRAEMVKARGMFASSARPKHAWIGAKSWPGEEWGRVSLHGSAYWEEMILQLGMHGISTFLLYSPYLPADTAEVTNLRISTVDSDQDRMQGPLDELNDIAGACSDVRVPVPPISWDSQVIISGRRVGSEVLYRVSFESGISSAELGFKDGSTVNVYPDSRGTGTWLKLPASKVLERISVGTNAAMVQSKPTTSATGDRTAQLASASRSGAWAVGGLSRLSGVN